MKRELLIAYIALGAICLIWGTTYLALRVAVLHFPPFLFTAIRQSTAGLLLLAFMILIAKKSLPGKKHLWHQAIGGFFMIAIGNGLVAWAELHIPSGIAAILCSLMPVMVIIINLSVNKDERPTVPIILGTLIGLAGIIMIFGENLNDLGQTSYVLGIIATIMAVTGWAGGSIWIKKFNGESNPFVNAGLQMFFGGLWLYPVSFIFDDLQSVTWSAEAGYSFLYLILVGSITAYACYAYALRKLPMTIVSLYAYINPIVAVILGWLILGEKLNLRMGLAILITIAGIYIVNRGYQLRNVWKAQFSK